MSNYVWHPQRSTEILECLIVSSIAKDCLVLSQYDLHHGSFLLVTPIVIKALLLTVTVLPFGGMLCSVSFVQSKENAQEKRILMMANSQMNDIGKLRGKG